MTTGKRDRFWWPLRQSTLARLYTWRPACTWFNFVEVWYEKLLLSESWHVFNDALTCHWTVCDTSLNYVITILFHYLYCNDYYFYFIAAASIGARSTWIPNLIEKLCFPFLVGWWTGPGWHVQFLLVVDIAKCWHFTLWLKTHYSTYNFYKCRPIFKFLSLSMLVPTTSCKKLFFTFPTAP